MTRFTLLASLFCAACTSESIERPRLDPSAPIDEVMAPGDDVPPTDSRCIPFDNTLALFGSTDHDELRDVIVTDRGSIIVAGYEDGRDHAGSTIGSRGVVLEYANGFKPRATLDTLGTDTFESLAITPATGRIWLAARTNGAIKGLPIYGGFDYVIGELAATGFRADARGFDTTPDHPRQLVAGPDLLALVGHEERPMLDGSTWTNPWLATFDLTNDGISPRWLTTRRSPETERYTAVDVSSQLVISAGVIADGDSQGTYITARSRDVDVLWEQPLTNHGTDTIAAVRFLSDGAVLWAGTAKNPLRGDTDIVVGRLDSTTGAEQWTMRYGGVTDERVADLAIDATGMVRIAGDVVGTDRDAFMVVLDSEGNVVTEEQWASDGDDVPTAIAVDSCGTSVLVGHTTGALGNTSHGGRDGFVIVTRSN
jgi:hypothetical protein